MKAAEAKKKKKKDTCIQKNKNKLSLLIWNCTSKKIVKLLIGKDCKPGILYPVKISIGNEGEMKALLANRK